MSIAVVEGNNAGTIRIDYEGLYSAVKILEDQSYATIQIGPKQQYASEQLRKLTQKLESVELDVRGKAAKLQESSVNAGQIALDGKSEVVTNLTIIFAGLLKLSATIKGDFDSKPANAPDRTTAQKQLDSLTSAANTAVTASDGAATKIKNFYLQNVDLRMKLGQLKESLNQAAIDIQTESQDAQSQLETQGKVVEQARQNYNTAKAAFDKAQKEYNDAQAEHKGWENADDNIPWWTAFVPFVGIPMAITKGVVAAGSAITESFVNTARINYETQTSFYFDQMAEKERLESVIDYANASVTQTTALKSMAGAISTQCESTIKACQAAEGIISQAKSNLNNIYGKCKFVQEYVGRSNYTEKKEDYLSVILETLYWGTFDKALAGPAKDVLQSVIDGDSTYVLSQDELAQKVNVIHAISSKAVGSMPLSG